MTYGRPSATPAASASALAFLFGLWLITAPLIPVPGAVATAVSDSVAGSVIVLLSLVRFAFPRSWPWLSLLAAIAGLWILLSRAWWAAEPVVTVTGVLCGLAVLLLSAASATLTLRLDRPVGRR
ncbi:putative membrane protein YpjA [Actinokineospora baliensis]|uniref:hypothetical protein n=1 Tax=Actinokineospora baliensis TaxID=547056 RepID=UPI00195B434C|nr:hypothetical protein [Actinokineospora baliensis]MBM7774049.1 putative membrane protein YpjA [Actinokineospora baliensis]